MNLRYFNLHTNSNDLQSNALLGTNQKVSVKIVLSFIHIRMKQYPGMHIVQLSRWWVRKQPLANLFWFHAKRDETRLKTCGMWHVAYVSSCLPKYFVSKKCLNCPFHSSLNGLAGAREKYCDRQKCEMYPVHSQGSLNKLQAINNSTFKTTMLIVQQTRASKKWYFWIESSNIHKKSQCCKCSRLLVLLSN